MKKNEVVCSGCTSIVEVNMERLSSDWYTPFHEQAKAFKKQIQKMETYNLEILKKSTSLFYGDMCRQSYFRTSRMVESLKESLEEIEKCMDYTHYYKCPICKHKTYIKTK